MQVEPVMELAVSAARELGALPGWLRVDVRTYDVLDCDAARAIISAVDAYTYDCAHVFFGPVCDYALGEWDSIYYIMKFIVSNSTLLSTTMPSATVIGPRSL